jgi:hypothetical protein
MSKNITADRAPSEQELIRLTLDRLDDVARRHDTTARQLCRIILKDTKIYDRLRARALVTDSGTRKGRKKKPQGSVTLHVYGRLHEGLDNL